MNRTETMNYIIQKKGYKTYLEIGTQYGWNYDYIDIESKECCDVDDSHHEMTYTMTSDELFATLPKDKKYDMIFIDGLHHELFVHRDIINSLKHLNPGGVICVHDVIPINYTATTAYYDGEIHKQGWNGDVWKAIANLQNFNIEFYTIFNEDQGLTIIKYRENPYELNISDVKTNIKYEFVWDDNYDRLDAKHFTPQGQFIMHVIDESHIDYIL